MTFTEIQLFTALKQKLGEVEAEQLVEFVKKQMGDEFFTKGSDSENNSLNMETDVGNEFGFAYSSNFKGISRFTFGLRFTTMKYHVGQIFDNTYSQNGVIGLPVKTSYNFNQLGPYIGWQIGHATNKIIYYCTFSVGYNSNQGEKNISYRNLPDSSETYSYNLHSQLNADTRLGFGKYLGINYFILELFYRWSGTWGQDPGIYNDNDTFQFHWRIYGVAIKMDFRI
jgi:hypothetical protein